MPAHRIALACCLGLSACGVRVMLSRVSGSDGSVEDARLRDANVDVDVNADARPDLQTGSDGSSPPLVPTVAGCPLFTEDDDFNTQVVSAPVDSTRTASLQALAGTKTMSVVFGSSRADPASIPFNVVPETQPLVPVTFDRYGELSDPGPYAFPDPETAWIAGGDPYRCTGNCQLIALQRGRCLLYEGWKCHHDRGWICSSGAIFDLRRNSFGQTPVGAVAASGGGTPILPGLVRYDEVAAGEIRHALSMMFCTNGDFVRPATHGAIEPGCAHDDPRAPPMGIRLRLKADYELARHNRTATIVLSALKTYGAIVTDNGRDWTFRAANDTRWTDELYDLWTVPASAFEVVIAH